MSKSTKLLEAFSNYSSIQKALDAIEDFNSNEIESGLKEKHISLHKAAETARRGSDHQEAKELEKEAEILQRDVRKHQAVISKAIKEISSSLDSLKKLVS